MALLVFGRLSGPAAGLPLGKRSDHSQPLLNKQDANDMLMSLSIRLVTKIQAILQACLLD